MAGSPQPHGHLSWVKVSLLPRRWNVTLHGFSGLQGCFVLFKHLKYITCNLPLLLTFHIIQKIV